MNGVNEHEQAVKYLLGQLTGDELEAVESRFFTDPDYSDFLDEVEFDLIDEYVRGELTDDERSNFERYYLTSATRENRVRAAVALHERGELDAAANVPAAVPDHSPSIWEKLYVLLRIPTLAYAVSAVAVIFLAGAIWFSRRDKEADIVRTTTTPTLTPIVTPTIEKPPATPDDANSGSDKRTDLPNGNVNTPATPRPQPSPKKTADENDRIDAPKPFVATFILSGGGLRGSDDVQRLKIGRGTGRIVLRIVDSELEKYGDFQLIVENAAGETVETRSVVPKKRLTTLAIPLETKRLPNGEYKLTVRGRDAAGNFEPVNFYRFRVEKN